MGFGASCPACQGTGQQVTRRCAKCGGSGEALRNRRLNVKIPPGVKTGKKLLLAGEGRRGVRGGPNGDLVLVIQVRPHSFFHREGDDIEIKLPVSFLEASLGAKISVPTVHGKVSLTIPPGTRAGQKFRLRAQGAPNTEGGQGDQYVEVYITVPHKLTKRQKELLEEFAAEWPEDVREGLETGL